MSFGASPSDIIICVTFARRLYRQCKSAGGEYLEISREVRGLHTVLKHLKFEVEAPESTLNRDHSMYARELAPVIGDCDFTLRQLDELLQKYGRLADSKAGGAERLWDKIRFGSVEMDQLGDIRMKLINHKTSITMLLDTVQLHESSRMSAVLDNQGGQLDKILDKVDNIAARMGQKSGSILTTYDDDDKEVWKQFRRELVAEGFSSDVLQQHKDVLRAYIREMDQNGLLVDLPPDPKARQPPGVNPASWLEGVQSPASEQGAPPSFDSLRTNAEDVQAKELVFPEDNMKFPPSMKLERPKPDSAPPSPDAGTNELEHEASRQLTVPRTAEPHRDGSATVDTAKRVPSPIPKLVTSLNSPTSKRIVPEYLPPPTPPKSIISTSDIIMSEGLVPPSDRKLSKRNQDDSTGLHSPPGSPTHSRSSFTEDAVPRLITQSSRNLAPDTAHYGTSPSSQLGTSPSSHFSTSPACSRPPVSPHTQPADRPSLARSASTLRPDSQGRPIPLDAKWTQIRRSLISTEVLDKAGHRYEARPDFVAILGVLSRDEVEDLAARSHAIRQSRRRPVPIQPPRQPPRPRPRRHSSSDGELRDERERIDRDERDRLYDTSSDEEPRYRATAASFPAANSAPSGEYTTQPMQPQYPSSSWSPQPPPQMMQPRHSYNGPMPLPMWIPGPGQPMMQQPQAGYLSPMMQQPTYLAPPQEDPRRRRSSADKEHDSSGKHHSKKDKDEKPKDGRVQGRRRWGENLTAGAIGGAAVSLLTVLSEAAENL